MELIDKQKQSRIAEIRSKSEFGRVVRVQANTVHDLMSDIRFILGEMDGHQEEIAKLKEERESEKRYVESVRQLFIDMEARALQAEQELDQYKLAFAGASQAYEKLLEGLKGTRETLETIRAQAWNDVNLRSGGVGAGLPVFMSIQTAKDYIAMTERSLSIIAKIEGLENSREMDALIEIAERNRKA